MGGTENSRIESHDGQVLVKADAGKGAALTCDYEYYWVSWLTDEDKVQHVVLFCLLVFHEKRLHAYLIDDLLDN